MGVHVAFLTVARRSFAINAYTRAYLTHAAVAYPHFLHLGGVEQRPFLTAGRQGWGTAAGEVGRGRGAATATLGRGQTLEAARTVQGQRPGSLLGVCRDNKC